MLLIKHCSFVLMFSFIQHVHLAILTAFSFSLQQYFILRVTELQNSFENLYIDYILMIVQGMW